MVIEQLKQIAILSSADSEMLRRCLADGQIFSGQYAKGATVHRQHDRCAALDVVLSGELVAYSLAENGSAVTLFEFKKDGIIGANLLFADGDTYPLNIYATTHCTLLHMTKEAVEALLHGHDFTMRYIKSLSLNSQGMNRKITMLTQKKLRDNLMDYLRHQALVQGSTDIKLPISKKELADLMGVQRPSLFRELKKMKEEGLIDVSNRLISIIR
jgi:CRP-like cAMP-binding protein